jgi:beta-galactosidase
MENHSVPGRTLQIGTFPGVGYYLHHSPGSRAFRQSLKMANVEPQLRTDNGAIQARLHAGAGGNYTLGW